MISQIAREAQIEELKEQIADLALDISSAKGPKDYPTLFDREVLVRLAALQVASRRTDRSGSGEHQAGRTD